MLYPALERMYYDYYFYARVKEHYIPDARYRAIDAVVLVGILLALYVAYRLLRYSFVIRTQPSDQ